MKLSVFFKILLRGKSVWVVRKVKKSIENGKTQVKWSLFTIIIYTENTKECFKKLLELISEINKVAR